MKMKTPTVVFFILLLLFWLTFRLGVLPFVIFKSIITESMLILEHGDVALKGYYAVRLMFAALIGCLCLPHV